MLFKTVYGPELECIYEFLLLGGPAGREGLYRAFLPLVDGVIGLRANLEDALTFLTSAGVVQKDEQGRYGAVGGDLGFKLLLLSKMRELQSGGRAPGHPLDPWFLGLVDSLFVRPARPLAFGLHQLVNSLDVPEVMSEEKVGAWKRVLEYLGLGGRLAAGFFCSYRPGLVLEIISLWREEEGPIQALLEGQIGKYLPWASEAGDISPPLATPLNYLAAGGHILLEERQDLPSRSYFGDKRIKWIRKGGGQSCSRASRKVV